MLFFKCRSQLPVDHYLPDGPIRDIGESYLHSLPDLDKEPLTAESFFQSSDKTWIDYLVAYVLGYPILVFLLGILFAALYILWRQYKSRLELRRRVPCVNCGEFVFRCSPHCWSCKSPQPAPTTLDAMGFSMKRKPAAVNYENRLRRHSRCHFCGQFLSSPKIVQQCPACGSEVFSTLLFIQQYDRYVQRRRFMVYGIVLIVSLIPIAGPLLASGSYRRVLVAPYRQYMAFGRESIYFTILAFLRFLFKYLPFIGIIGIPLLSIIENHAYRQHFLRKATKDVCETENAQPS